MQLSKLSYYSDFVVYPLVLIALTAININHVTWASGAAQSAEIAAGPANPPTGATPAH